MFTTDSLSTLQLLPTYTPVFSYSLSEYHLHFCQIISVICAFYQCWLVSPSTFELLGIPVTLVPLNVLTWRCDKSETEICYLIYTLH